MQPFALVTYHPETAADAGSPAVQSASAVQPPWTSRARRATGLSPARTPTQAGRSAPARMQALCRRTPRPRRASSKAWDCGGIFRPWTTPRWWRGTPPPAWWRRRPLRCPPSTSASGRRGALVCANVLCCDRRRGPVIEAALRRAFSPALCRHRWRHGADSPYGGGDTSGKICAVLQHFDFYKVLKFFMTALCRNLTPKGAFWYETSDRRSGQYGQAPRTPVQRH